MGAQPDQRRGIGFGRNSRGSSPSLPESLVVTGKEDVPPNVTPGQSPAVVTLCPVCLRDAARGRSGSDHSSGSDTMDVLSLPLSKALGPKSPQASDAWRVLEDGDRASQPGSFGGIGLKTPPPARRTRSASDSFTPSSSSNSRSVSAEGPVQGIRFDSPPLSAASPISPVIVGVTLSPVHPAMRPFAFSASALPSHLSARSLDMCESLSFDTKSEQDSTAFTPRAVHAGELAVVVVMEPCMMIDCLTCAQRCLQSNWLVW